MPGYPKEFSSYFPRIVCKPTQSAQLYGLPRSFGWSVLFPTPAPDQWRVCCPRSAVCEAPPPVLFRMVTQQPIPFRAATACAQKQYQTRLSTQDSLCPNFGDYIPLMQTVKRSGTDVKKTKWIIYAKRRYLQKHTSHLFELIFQMVSPSDTTVFISERNRFSELFTGINNKPYFSAFDM